MWGTGFEPAQALSYMVLSHARLTTPATPPNAKTNKNQHYKKLYKPPTSSIFEDGHSRLETPVPIPNTEVKLPTSSALVSEKMRNGDAVSLCF